MRITNKFNYPQTLVDAVKNDPYNKGSCDFSCTELIKPARISALEKQMAHDLEVDVDDQMFLLYGQIGHGVVERAGSQLGSNNVVEKRVYMNIEVGGATYKVSAQIDSLSLEEDGTLIDWKFTTVYGFKAHSTPKAEWVQQMNIQRLILRANNYEPKKLQIWGLLRDWRPGEKKRDPSLYPEKVGRHDIPVWDDEVTREFIQARIKDHVAAREGNLPNCTDEETWDGRRCKDYCWVAQHCSQYKDKLNAKRNQ